MTINISNHELNIIKPYPYNYFDNYINNDFDLEIQSEILKFK